MTPKIVMLSDGLGCLMLKSKVEIVSPKIMGLRAITRGLPKAQ